MKHLLRLIIISFLFNPEIFAQNYIQKPEGNVRNLESEEIQRNEQKGSYYNENWAYHVYLDNGSEIYLIYSISHFAGVQNPVSSARLTLLDWNNENIKVARQYDLDLLNFDEETYKMNLHPERGIWFEGEPGKDHRFYFRTKKDGIHFDISINFEETTKGFAWDDGIFKLGQNDEVGMFTHFPFSEVSGYIALDFDTVQVTGMGRMNHTYQTNVGTRLFDKSFEFSSMTSKGYTAGYFMIPADHTDEVIGYAYTVDGDDITLKKPIKMETLNSQQSMGEEVSQTIRIEYNNAESDTFMISYIKEKEAMLEEIGGIKKMLARRLLGGDILIFRGIAIKNNEFYSFSLSKSD